VHGTGGHSLSALFKTAHRFTIVVAVMPPRKRKASAVSLSTATSASSSLSSVESSSPGAPFPGPVEEQADADRSLHESLGDSIIWLMFTCVTLMTRSGNQKLDKQGRPIRRAECKLCPTSYSYQNTQGNLRNHYQKKHAAAYKKLLAGGGDEPQQPLPFLTSKFPKTRNVYLLDALVRWICLASRALKIVEDVGLGDVCKILTGDPDFSLPSRRTLKTQVDRCFIRMRKCVKRLIATSPAIALTADFWTSGNGRRTLGVTAHFITECWQLVSLPISVSYFFIIALH
jgi:hypothetical protein